MPPRTAAKKTAEPAPQDVEVKVETTAGGAPDDGLHHPLADDADASIHQRMIAVMADVRHVGKNQRITEGPARFAYRGIDDVMNAVGPAFRRHGVYLTSNILEREHVEVRTSGNKPSAATRLIVQYTFWCDAMSEQKAETTVAAEAWDTGDRGIQKAMSVALRTALLQMLVLPTGDPDPERDSFERADYDHDRSLQQMSRAKTRGQAVAIYNRAEAAGANGDQLAELKAAGEQLPAVTQGIGQQQEQRGDRAAQADPHHQDGAVPSRDDDVAANDPANDDQTAGGTYDPQSGRGL